MRPCATGRSEQSKSRRMRNDIRGETSGTVPHGHCLCHATVHQPEPTTQARDEMALSVRKAILLRRSGTLGTMLSKQVNAGLPRTLANLEQLAEARSTA